MTQALFREDAYLTKAEASVVGHSGDRGLLLDRSLFYPAGGGQPGDRGSLEWAGGGCCAIVDTIKGEGDSTIALAAKGAARPPVGAQVSMLLDWEVRYAHMRVHTALHL